MMYLEQIIEDLQKRVAELEERQPIQEEWLTIKEAAERLRVGQTTLYRKVKRGEVYASMKTGRVRIPISQFYGEKPEEEQVQEPRRHRMDQAPDDPRMAAVYKYVHGGMA